MSDDVLEELFTVSGARYRVRIVTDLAPHEPDDDTQPFAVEVSARYGDWSDRRRTTVRHGRSMSLDLPDWVEDAIAADDLDDWEAEVVAGRLGADHGCVVDYIGWGSGYLFLVATPELLEAWGTPADRHDQVVEDMAPEWRAYRDGDVYGVVVEQLATWRRVDDGDHDEMQTWEEVDSCWGFYGLGWAKERAAEMLREVAA